MVSEFRLHFTLRVFLLFFVRFGLLSGHPFTQLTICCFCILTSFNFRGLDLGSDCFSFWSLTACLVFNPIMVEGYAALFSCTAVVQASDSMTASM